MPDWVNKIKKVYALADTFFIWYGSPFAMYQIISLISSRGSIQVADIYAAHRAVKSERAIDICIRVYKDISVTIRFFRKLLC